MADLRERGEESPSQAEEYEKQLFELLARLNVNGMNPDLWMEAATIYVALGKENRASQAYQASLRVMDPAKAKSDVLERIRELLWGDVVPAGGDRFPGSAEGSDRTELDDARREPSILVSQAQLAAAEWAPPSFGSPEEALNQLRRELDPRATVTCPECNTLLESEDRLCYGCGLELSEEGGTLEDRVDVARTRLTEDEDDPDALFAMAAHLSVSGEHEEALEFLVRLTAVDPRYPGLWWVKAKVFLDAGKPDAARASARMAQEIWNEARTGTAS
jgi:tetratricopeptide (TPR) repeat protein